VQFPLEPICLIVGGIGCIPGPAYAVDVAVEVNGIVGRSFRISPTGLPHFLNSCDSINVNPTGICHPLTTHADGSFVAGIGLDPGWSPAHLGETINIYAVGLGSTLNGKTGQAASAPDRVTYDVYLTPALVTSTSAVFGTPVKADWAGLTPGYVGLYQINLTLPSNLPFAIPAGGYAGCSNLRLFWGQLTQENVSSDVPYVDVCVASASN
jgi:hypothetical protein